MAIVVRIADGTEYTAVGYDTLKDFLFDTLDKDGDYISFDAKRGDYSIPTVIPKHSVMVVQDRAESKARALKF